MWGANIILGAIALVLLVLNHREAAFDPLDAGQYLAWLPRIRRAPRPKPTAEQRSRATPAVVLRIPRPSIRLLGILDRYIAAQYIGHILLVVSRSGPSTSSPSSWISSTTSSRTGSRARWSSTTTPSTAPSSCI